MNAQCKAALRGMKVGHIIVESMTVLFIVLILAFGWFSPPHTQLLAGLFVALLFWTLWTIHDYHQEEYNDYLQRCRTYSHD